MKYLYICSTSSDSISMIDLAEFKVKKIISLENNNYDRVGPHGIYIKNDYIITANNYSNNISLVDINDKYSVKNYFIGMHCNDVKILNNKAYVICGDSNSVVVFDLINHNILTTMPCGSLPHSIDIDRRNLISAICNFNDDSITMMNCENNTIIKKIAVGSYPTKVLFSLNGNYIFVCESNIGLDSKGSLSIISLTNFNIITKVKLGYSPVDMCIDENYCFVSNFGEGTISIIDINNFKEVDVIKVGGMPRGIVKFDKDIYVCDNYNNTLIKININSLYKQMITIGGEPTGIMLY